MKKTLSLILALALCLSLCACKSDEVKNVEAQISALSESSTYQEIYAVNSLYWQLEPKEMEKVENLDILRQYCDSIGHFVLSDDMLQEIMAEFEVNNLGVSDAEFFIMYRLGIESVVKGWSDYGNIKIASHKQSDSYTYSVYGTFTAYDKFGSPSPMKFELYYYAEYSSEESCGYTISQSLIVRK